MKDNFTWLKSNIILYALVFIGIFKVVSTVPIIGKPLSVILVLSCIVFSIFSFKGNNRDNKF